MIDTDRIKLLVERNVQALMAANGARPKTEADWLFVADMTELGVGTLQAIHEIAFYLEQIASRTDRYRMSHSDPIEITAFLRREAGNAYLINDGAREVWVPKSQTEWDEDKTFTMPEWLAKEKGLI